MGNEAFPNRKKYCISGGVMVEFPQEIKEQVVIDLCARSGTTFVRIKVRCVQAPTRTISPEVANIINRNLSF